MEPNRDRGRRFGREANIKINLRSWLRVAKFYVTVPLSLFRDIFKTSLGIPKWCSEIGGFSVPYFCAMPLVCLYCSCLSVTAVKVPICRWWGLEIRGEGCSLGKCFSFYFHTHFVCLSSYNYVQLCVNCYLVWQIFLFSHFDDVVRNKS